VEGDGLRKALFDDRPNFGYRSNGTVIDQAAEVSAIAIGHLIGCVVHKDFCDLCEIKELFVNLLLIYI
jgi:hypothetical protein